MYSSDVQATLGKVPAFTPEDLERSIADGCTMATWSPEKWMTTKTIASAAAGEGSVELMTSQEEQSDRLVIVKKLPWTAMRSSPEEFNKHSPNAKERPWTDIAVLKHLNSRGFPYTREFLGVFLGDEQVYIMTSFANRGDLFTWCQTDKTNAGTARETVMRPLVSQLVSAVRTLHDWGIAHRSLSAESVQLTESGDNGLQIQIVDFGMASLSRMVSQEVRGKRSYQAPEMHTHAEYDTFLADIFSVGVIVYCMAVHGYPWDYTKPGKDRSFEFARANGVELLLQKKKMPCNKKPVAENVSSAFFELVCGLLALDPEKRYSLGEACFEDSSRKAVNSKSAWLSERADNV